MRYMLRRDQKRLKFWISTRLVFCTRPKIRLGNKHRAIRDREGNENKGKARTGKRKGKEGTSKDKKGKKGKDKKGKEMNGK